MTDRSRRCTYHFVCPNNRLVLWLSNHVPFGAYRFDAFVLYGLPFDGRCDRGRAGLGRD